MWDQITGYRLVLPEEWHGIHLPGLVPYIAMIGMVAFILTILPGLIWIERVVIALMQDRPGPNHMQNVSKHGWKVPQSYALHTCYKRITSRLKP